MRYNPQRCQRKIFRELQPLRPSTSYIINDNKLIQRNPLEKLSNRLIKDVEGFINKYKDTGRLFVVYEKYVSIDNILILKADNNYNFKAFIK